MKRLTADMIKIWNMTNMDWMGYKLCKENQPTFHHIVKECDGGKRILDNGAIIGKENHTYLHIVEDRDLEMYIYLSNILKSINDQRYMPSKRQLLAIDAILRQFEREHCSDRTSKGKVLIKECYTKRITTN